jgi:hypothetical protein
VSRIDEYRAALAGLDDPEPYALAHSGLPGPRGNLELISALAETADEPTLRRWAAFSPQEAPGNEPPVVLAVAGIVGLGRFLDDRPDVLPFLHTLASDPRWRVREGVAMALQRLGVADMRALLNEMRAWARGNQYEQRAAAAALCEPALLKNQKDARSVLTILDRITTSLSRSGDRRSESFRVLRKGLAYCWSVAAAAAPAEGRARMERWLDSDDPDVTWVMKQNLTKKRMGVVGADWVSSWQKTLADR